MRLLLLFFVAISLWCDCTVAQKLSDILKAENPNTLATDARKKGNIVRGAILFHQGKTNCAKCHQPKAEKNRIGPDLSRRDPKATDAFIVESILHPSKSIKKGFETVSVLTLDGKVIDGIIFKEDAQKLVIRDNRDVDRLVTIRRDDVDEIQPGQVSSMPDGLVDELKSRQHFLDLVRYVLDVRERGPSVDVVKSDPTQPRQLSSELKGLVLIQERNCIACHQSEVANSLVAAKTAPHLKWSGRRLNPDHMIKFISDPQSVKPGTTMPNMLDHLSANLRLKSAKALTQYIISRANNEFKTQPIDVEAASRGFELFHSVGCVACHAPRDSKAVEKPLDNSTALGDLSQKYNIAGLVELLENPHVVRPSGRMPNMQLTNREAIDISNYLLQRTANVAAQIKTDSSLAEKGKLLFSELNCNSCHAEIAGGKTKPVSRLALNKLRPKQGCSSDKRGNWPNFEFNEQQRKFIRATLSRFPSKLSDEQRIQVALKSFNCTACHERGGIGGVTAQRSPHFQTTNLNLGEQGRMPPTLTGVGAKLKSKWMRDVLVNGRAIRPYMKTRMPQYGEENVGYLAPLFQKTDRISKTNFAAFKDQKKMREQGLQLAGNKGLNCVACHTYQYKISDTMPAVDLTEMTDRLKKDWFYQYLLAPQKFSPNTVMPSFWPAGVAIRKDIPGDPATQVEALWQYLIDGRQARAPSGVVRERLEIVVANEAKILRRSYPGIGKRGIGVGYPGGVNLAFDAEQMRLGFIWKGKFVDPSGVWTGQGSGNVRPLGKTIDFPKGPELDDRSKPWVVDDGRPPNHRFKGYVLDQFRRPTFHYVFESVEVADFFSEFTDEATGKVNLRRSVSLSTARQRKNLSFRIVSAKEITATGDRLYEIGERLKIRLISNQKAQIVDSGDGQMLKILLDLDAGKDQKLVIEYLWD